MARAGGAVGALEKGAALVSRVGSHGADSFVRAGMGARWRDSTAGRGAAPSRARRRAAPAMMRGQRRGRAARRRRARRRRRADRGWRRVRRAAARARPGRSAAAARRPSGCTVQNTQGVPSRRRSGNSARFVMPQGGRKKRGGRPAAWAMASWPSTHLAARSRPGPDSQRLRWLHVWLPRSWPSAAMRRASAGAAAARRPMRKKAPRTPCAARMSSTRGVVSGIGPVVEGERDRRGGRARPRQTLPRVRRCEPHV